ncbi:MAG: TonB-dependent receptor [Flavobacteriales bacterium]|nr:MAG: TonB-dependent receptor [Flavobacteriales bacterium]
MHRLHYLFILPLLIPMMVAAQLRGFITDHQGEPLVGATVRIVEQSQFYAITGLDGSYIIKNLPNGQYKIEISYVGYQTQILDLTLKNRILEMNIALIYDNTLLNEITVMTKAVRGSEAEARIIERVSANTVNVVSAKAIELSPDISVANVIQRVSGLTLERNSAGDPQYAVVRGMDKRYNYTLVNGVKISSPDNQNRYIPLDIFPANLLERLEVHKSLTADMEGDAIGGAINMVMKTAPDRFEIRGDIQSGYSLIHNNLGFNRYDLGSVNPQSPLERFGTGFNALPEDFSMQNVHTENIIPMPDILGNVSIGQRFLDGKLGFLAAASFQNSYRSTESIWFDYSIQSDNDNLVPRLDKLQERYYSTRQGRYGFHTNADWKPNKRNTITWYNGYYILNDQQVRELTEYRLGGGMTMPSSGNAEGMKVATRTRFTNQSIFNSTLRGEHLLSDQLTLDWSSVVSSAKRNRPDIAEFNRITEMRDFEISPQRVYRENPRRWERNEDADFTQFVNLSYKPINRLSWEWKTGGMIRTKTRSNFFNRYIFEPENAPSTQGQEWEVYEDVEWRIINPQGTITNALNYSANEDISAAFLQSAFQIGKTSYTLGVRAEHTRQGYVLDFTQEGQISDTTQIYLDWLPSAHFKYEINGVNQIRGGYYYAISRPGFFEIVPYNIIDEDYNERGNPNLNRVRAHNLDLRYEYFPSFNTQIMGGVFYKYIIDPIEYALIPFGSRNQIVLQPNNFGDAVNYGFEIDFTHFFKKLGFKANYTFTQSELTAVKSRVIREDRNDPSSQLITVNENEVRPLQGQARHIGNLSVLFKDEKSGWEAQLAFTYTGERLENVSPFYRNDSYALPILLADLSAEKRLKNGHFIFARVNNLLNSPYKVVVKGNADPAYAQYPHQENIDLYTLIRRDQYMQMFRVGYRFQF